jgi:hypothetical protein
VATGCSWADATYLPSRPSYTPLPPTLLPPITGRNHQAPLDSAGFPHFSSQSLDSAGLIDFADTVGVGCQYRIQLAPLDFA